METSVITTLISTSGAVIVGLGGMWISTNQIGKRLGSLERRFERLEDELRTFKEMVSGKFSALDLELAKLMDGRG
jgi:hypothetical protein